MKLSLYDKINDLSLKKTINQSLEDVDDNLVSFRIKKANEADDTIHDCRNVKQLWRWFKQLLHHYETTA